MFTGIIRTVSPVVKAEKKTLFAGRQGGSLFLTIQTPKGWRVRTGESIATDGVCLTVARVGKGRYTCELMTETLQKTYFGVWMPTRVNLEKSLHLSDPLDGHLVLGHVDTIGRIKKIQKQPSGVLYTFSFPEEFARLVVPKGSIAVDGISLTVVDAARDWFSVSLVEYTLKHTAIRYKRTGEPVNLEFDIIGKYLVRLYGTGGPK